MTTATPTRPVLTTSRRLGHLAAAIGNLVCWWIVVRLPDWELGFLTAEIDEVVGVVSVSCAVGAALNLVWVWWRPAWAWHLGQAVINVISVIVTTRVWQVWPFDVSTPLDVLARVLVAVAFVGSIFGVVTELRRLAAASLGW
jgi:hypothetical protein